MSRSIVALTAFVALLLSLPFAAAPAIAASEDHAPPPGAAALPAAPVATGPCLITGDIVVTRPDCLQAADGSITVSWTVSGRVDSETATAVIEAAQLGMERYRGLQLTAATISSDNPLRIAIQPGDDSPAYSWKTGTVWIGAVAAKKLVGSGQGVTAESRLELWHELFHWIEDEQYYMGWARINGDYTWWLETAAEVGVGLIDANGMERNASLYGRSTLDDMRTLVTQVAPYQWITAEQYGQALLLRANICDEGCPLTQASFVAAINAGTYPLQDASARAQVRKNMQRYATYLLTGRLPGMDTNAPLAAGANGDAIALVASESAPWDLRTTSYAPQVDKTAWTVTAPLAADSAYPLLIAGSPAASDATGTALPPGQPATLTVDPGVELVYVLGDGKVRHHDGAKPLVITPIHANLGEPMVRLVAFTKDAPATLTAKLEPLDLTGDWLFTLKGGRLISNTCPSEDDSASDASDQDILGQLMRWTAPRGSYEIRDDRLPGDLEWVLGPGKNLRVEAGEPELTYEATLSVEPTQVVAHVELGIPRAGKGDAGIVGPALAAVVMLPFGAFAIRHRRRVLAGLALLVMASLISGCAGFGISGTITTDLVFTKLQSMGQKVPKAKPTWKVSGGTGTLVLDLTIDIESTNQKGKVTKESQHCVAEIAVKATGALYRDGVLKPPKL
jgi:hypothetical protein